jgi:ABC-2 type transport system permease protein
VINRTLENASSWYNYKYISLVHLKNSTLDTILIRSSKIENSVIKNSTVKECQIINSTFENCLLYHSSGSVSGGKNIVSVGSALEFNKKESDEFRAILDYLLNMELIIFIILPAALPTFIASYSLVGEKNNKSLEPLLATPTTDAELLVGKIMSAFVPTMASTYFAFVCSMVIIDIFLTPVYGYPPVPTLTWVLAMVLVAPFVSLMGILACIPISARVTDVRAAQQLGGFVVMPVVFMMIFVFSGLILLSPYTVLVVALIYLVVDIVLFMFAKRMFNRENILTKWA